MTGRNSAKLVFDGGFDERDAVEAKDRGYCGRVLVEFPDGSRYPVVVWDPVRIGQDLQAETGQGNPYSAQAGMIVIPEVTEPNMRETVARLSKSGFFRRLRPL